MTTLPDGWTTCPFTDAFDVQGGTQPPKSTFIHQPRPGYVQLLQIRDFGSKPVPTYIEDTSSLKKCSEQDILIARYGASLGRILTGLSGAYNVAMAKVDIPDGFVRRYVFHLLNSSYFQDPLKLVSRSAQNGFNKSDLSEFLVPIAPINEQKRIADKLDSLLSRVDSCRERLDRVPAILRRFRQSVLAAATSGKLTEEWRAENPNTLPYDDQIARNEICIPASYKRLTKQEFRTVPIQHNASSLPPTWSIHTIADLYESNVLIDFADGNHGGLYPRKEEFGNDGVLFLTAMQVGERWEIDLGNCPRLNAEKASQLVKGWATNGDVLLSHNATVGRVALVEDSEENILLGTSLTFYRFNNEYIDPRFARILFSSRFFQDQLESCMEQTTRNQVPITRQVSLHFVCPPIEEQREIVRRVDSLLLMGNKLLNRIEDATACVESLTPAVLAKAFRGELVPQDPNDEPANVLLERIGKTKGKNGDESKKKGRSKMTRTIRKSNSQIRQLTAVLQDNGGVMTPEKLFAAAGYTDESIEDFYLALKKSIANGAILDPRDHDNQIVLVQAQT